MLASKKKEYSLLAREVNVAKEQIDKSLQWINCMRCAREAEGPAKMSTSILDIN